MFSNLCSKKWEKKIASKDYSILVDQTFYNSYYTKTTQGRTSVFDIGGWVGGASRSIARLHTHRGFWGECVLWEAKILYFETDIVHYGDISANLDQAMSKKKKKKKKKNTKIHAKKKQKQKQKQKTNTHTHPPTHTPTHTHTHTVP